MKDKTTDIIINVLNFGKRLMLTLFAGLFALTALGGLTYSITEGGFMGVFGCVVCAFMACICWSIRRDWYELFSVCRICWSSLSLLRWRSQHDGMSWLRGRRICIFIIQHQDEAVRQDHKDSISCPSWEWGYSCLQWWELLSRRYWYMQDLSWLRDYLWRLKHTAHIIFIASIFVMLIRGSGRPDLPHGRMRILSWLSLKFVWGVRPLPFSDTCRIAMKVYQETVRGDAAEGSALPCKNRHKFLLTNSGTVAYCQSQSILSLTYWRAYWLSVEASTQMEPNGNYVFLMYLRYYLAHIGMKSRDVLHASNGREVLR